MTLLSKKLNALGLSQKELAKKAGVSQPYISQVLDGKILKYNAAKKFADAFGFNFFEILADFEGSNPDKKTDALHQLEEIRKKSNGQHRPNRDEGKEINIEDVHSVRAIVIPAKGQAGLQAQYFDEVLFKDLETEELLTTDKHAGRYFKIEVTGDSMDDGTPKGLQAGDWAYCRSLSKLHWRDKLHTHKWRIWCFFHNERGIIFKSIVSHDPVSGDMELESLNPNKELYPNFEINIGECSYVCNVVKKLSPL